MNIDNARIDAAIAALKACNELEAACAVFTYQRDLKTRGPGRPRGRSVRIERVQNEKLPTVAEMSELAEQHN